MYTAIVLLPLWARPLPGSWAAVIGARASEIVTTWLLFVSAGLSIVAFNDVALVGHIEIIQILAWIYSGDFACRLDDPGRYAITAVMLVVVTGVSSLVHLYSIGYMHDDPHRPRFFSFLSLFTFAMLMLVTANNFLPTLLRLGRRGPGLLSADRLLVHEALRQRRRDQGVHRQPRRRFRLRARHFRHLLPCSSTLDFDAVFAAAPAIAGKTVHLRRPQRRHSHHALPALFVGAMGKSAQIGPAHLAARRDGRPNARLRPDPRRHHGDGRRVPGLPLLAHVRTMRRCALEFVTFIGAIDGLLRRLGRPVPERHQARDRLFDLLATWLHVRCRRRVGL